MISTVKAGRYEGGFLKQGLNKLILKQGFKTICLIDGKSVKAYEVLDQDSVRSGSSAFLRGATGAMFLGPVGLLFAAGAKNKNTYVVAVEWYDSKDRSLIQMNTKDYDIFLRKVFR